MQIDVYKLQEALKDQGFDPGEIDGQIGRKTIAAVAAFQKARGLEIVNYGTVGPKTIEALFGVDNKPGLMVARPWFDLALTKKGLHEKRNHDEVKAFLRSDGATLGDPAKLPWCGDFVETCIAITLKNEILPINPYLARNWAKFGKHVSPTLGAILSFWRGNPSGSQGHVGFYAGENKSGSILYVLGGNQSDSISVAPLAANRLLDSRWPLTATAPTKRERPIMVGGKLSINEA